MVDSEQEPEAPEGNPKPKGKTQKEIYKVVEQLAKMELKQRKYEGDEEGHEELSNYWLKYKIWDVWEQWRA